MHVSPFVEHRFRGGKGESRRKKKSKKIGKKRSR